MAERAQNLWLAGVDGCKQGWVAAFMRPDGSEAHIRDVFANFSELLVGPDAPTVVAVDIPIGFPKHSMGGRAPDNAVRKLLGKGSASVFPMPSRCAVFAERGPFSNAEARRLAHQRACAVAEATSSPPKRIPIFAFGLFPKIQQVDDALTVNPVRKHCVFETHPEVAFRELNKEAVLVESKKTDAGKDKRKRLLIAAGLSASLVNSPPPKGAKTDDLLDALVCAIVARRIHDNIAKCFPNQPEFDEQLGLQMAIRA
jgi:predicted RNase H-like nuclease